MAAKRMFSLDVIDTDKFMDMPNSTQSLYFHLGMRSDDEGFVSSPRKITRLVGCQDDDLKLLIAKGYIIPFNSGVIVIADWNINNWVRPDRKHSTLFQHEKGMLGLENGTYFLLDNLQPNDNQVTAKCHTEISIDKNSINKNNKQCASDNAPKVSKAAINEFFESIWKLYPSKKGNLFAISINFHYVHRKIFVADLIPFLLILIESFFVYRNPKYLTANKPPLYPYFIPIRIKSFFKI